MEHFDFRIRIVKLIKTGVKQPIRRRNLVLEEKHDINNLDRKKDK